MSDRVRKYGVPILLTASAVAAMSVAMLGCCDSSRASESSGGWSSKRMGFSTNRYVDAEAGVVCYSMNGKGIYCLPLSDTNLKAAP